MAAQDEYVGVALSAKAKGAGYRRIAAALARPPASHATTTVASASDRMPSTSTVVGTQRRSRVTF